MGSCGEKCVCKRFCELMFECAHEHYLLKGNPLYLDLLVNGRRLNLNQIVKVLETISPPKVSDKMAYADMLLRRGISPSELRQFKKMNKLNKPDIITNKKIKKFNIVWK